MVTDVKGKPWWLSRGAWGPVVAMLGMIFSAVGVELDASVVVEGILYLVTFAGVLLGWWGRMDASEAIDKRQVLPGVRLPGK